MQDHCRKGEIDMNGLYYLHMNGDLIYERDLPGMAADIRDSDLAKALWFFDPSDRASAWQILVEARAIGANKDRIDELAQKWGCDDKDAEHYADYLNVGLQLDGNSWCATPEWFVNLQESPAGFGDTCLEAFADLAKNLGYKGGKMWYYTFKTLLKYENK